MSSLIPSSSGVLTIPVLNVNFLYIQGNPLVDFSGSIVFLQQEIDQLDNEVNALQAIVNRIDLTGLTGNLVITDANKNSVLLTAIQNLQGQVGNINQFDLTALAPYPPAHITITPTTTNQALDLKITDISNSVFSLNTKVTDLSNNVSSLNTKVTDLSNNVTTINGQITALQNQVTSINNSITAINAKIVHITTWTVAGGTVMTGIRDNTGFAVDLSADDSSNGLFVYPNGDGHNAQVRIETAQDKQLYMRGGSAVTLYAGANGSNTSRNAIFIGDQSDNIKIGSFSGAVTFPLVEIGCSGVGLADSTTRLKGDVYLTKHTEVSPIYTQVVTADGDAGFVGRLDTQSRLSLSGLAVTTTVTNPIIPITNLFGAITLTTGAGLISLIAGVGGINITAGGGAVAISTGGGAMSINCGAGVLNMASGTGNSNWTTATGDIYLGAGKGTGGTSGGITMASVGNIVIQPDLSLNIYHTDFIEMNTYGVAPATITRRIYDISGDLYYNGVLLSSDPSGAYVLLAGDTMTGTLVAPKITTPLIDSSGNFLIDPSGGSAGYNKTSYIEMVNNPSAPATVSQRIYDICGNLYYNGTILSNTPDPSGIYVLKTGDTMTGNLNVPTIQTTQISSFVTDLSLNASLNVVVNPTLEGRYNKTGYIEFNDNTSPPAVTANRLYQQANQLFFDGSAIGGGGGGGLPLTGGTLTGALNIVYDGGQATPQLQITNTNNTAPVSGQGGIVTIRNDATGAGSVGERCGRIDFTAKDTAGVGRGYASIQTFINDPTSTSIDGRLSALVTSNSTSTEMLRLVSTSTGVRQINLGATNTIIGATAIGASTTDTLRVQGSTSITTTLDVPLIQNAVNIYPATSTTLVDNAVRQYQPERLYKLTNYPEPLGAPTRDGEKVYFVNPSGNPTNLMDSFTKTSDFPAVTGGATFQYIQKCIFYKGSANSGLDAYYLAVRYSDANSYIFCFLDLDATTWKMYWVATIQGTVNDMVGGNPLYSGGGFQQRVYVVGSFTTGATSSNPTSFITLNNVGQIGINIQQGGIGTLSVVPLFSAKDPARGHEPAFNNVAGVSGTVNCITNASGLNGLWGTPTNSDILVIGGLFYNIGAVGNTGQRSLASIAFYNIQYTSGLQTDQIGWSSLTENNQTAEPIVGVGSSSVGKNVWGIGFLGSGWGVMVYEGADFNNDNGSVTNCNSMVYFYKSSGTSCAFQIPNSDDGFIQSGQQFPIEAGGNVNRTNVIKGGSPATVSASVGEFVYSTLCVTNGVPSALQQFGINWRIAVSEQYQNVLALVIDDNNGASVTLSRCPQLQFGSFPITGFYSNTSVYGANKYFLGSWDGNVFSGYTTEAQNLGGWQYNTINYNAQVAPVRSFTAHSDITGYTGLNCYGGLSPADQTSNWIYKTTALGDLTVELSGCLVRTAPNIIATDTITFLGVSDGSSLMLLGDTSTSGNPQGKPCWWAISQDGAIKYDNTTVGGTAITNIIGGTGISSNGGNTPTITNTGVTQIVAGTNVTITDTGGSGNGIVTINASVGAGSAGGFVKVAMIAFGVPNVADNAPHFNSYDPAFGQGFSWGGIAVNKFQNVAGGTINGIQYTGTNTIAVQFNINPLFNVSEVTTGNALNMLDSPYDNKYRYSSFGINSYVTDANGALRADQPVQTSMMCGAGSANSATAGVANDYKGVFSCSFIMRKNDIIKINAVSNAVFNTASGQPANTFYFQGGSITDGVYASITCWEVVGV